MATLSPECKDRTDEFVDSTVAVASWPITRPEVEVGSPEPDEVARSDGKV